MSKPLSTENKVLYDLLTKVLGYSSFGFLDQEQWVEFQDKYFFREGEVSGEKYSLKVNRHLSGAAMQHTLEEIRNKLEEYFKEQG